LFDTGILDASHILLDAQYMDVSMMRNALALFITRRLGRPASLAEHVELYINDDYYGLYTQIERIDQHFFDRNDLGSGPVFRSVNKTGRFAWQPADISGTYGFEARRGSDEALSLVRQLIDAVNLLSPLSIDLDDYLAYAAVTLAIIDNDAMVINYFFFLSPEGIWRIFPWDRDTSFGISNTGEYSSGWLDDRHVSNTQRAALAARLLAQSCNRDLFDDYLLQTGVIMRDELPSVIDSIYLAIRESVYADTLKPGTNSEFDEAVAVLRQAVIDRGQFLQELPGTDRSLSVESMVLSEWEFLPGGASDSVTVTITFQDEARVAYLYSWTDGSELEVVPMSDINGYSWTSTISFPAAHDEMHLAVKYRARIGSGIANSAFYYPLYGPPYLARDLSAPTVRRSHEDLDPDSFEILLPVRITPYLWYIPLVNTSDAPQDISFCGFQTGDPPARLFAGADMLVMPGDTLLLTNSRSVLEVILPGRTILGDLVIDSPADTQLLLLYPSWGTAIEMTLGPEVAFYQSGLVLNELMARNETTIADNFGEYDDWIEITNSGPDAVDLSGYYLTDDIAYPFKFAFPDTVIQPGEYFIVWADDDPEQGSMHAEFKLSSSGEGVYLLYSLLLVDEVVFPALGEDVSFGRWPDASGAWEILALATPGAPNEGGTEVEGPVEPGLRILAPNPICGSGLITIHAEPGPVRLDVYDLYGRLVDSPFDGEIISSISFSWDITPLSTGLYFLRLVQGEETIVRKITLMR